LQVGSTIVLATLGLGLQVGGWPLWTAVIALAGYAAWTVAYSEVTVQVERWRLGFRPLSGRLKTSQSAAPPA
jgi:hypothetical protein